VPFSVNRLHWRVPKRISPAPYEALGRFQMEETHNGREIRFAHNQAVPSLFETQPLELAQFGKIALPREEARLLTSAALVERLVAAGASRLTAHRIVEVERGGDMPGRARKHRLDR
jgi:hypothetical protein